MSRIRHHLLLAPLLVLMLAACSGGEENDSGSADLPTATSTSIPVESRDGGPTAAAVAGTVPAERGEQTGRTDQDRAEPASAVEVVDRVSPAVVTVINEQQAGGFGSAPAQEAGRGTGFIVDSQGHVVTNEHVVRGGDRFEVIFADGEKRPASLVGADPLSDLAVVRVEGGIPATVPFGNSEILKPGQPVLAIGSPLGSFTNTVTDGIVSALGRDFPGAPNQGEPGYSNLIQHNAAINPGNSGGPLFNFAGEVVGVNTLGIPETNQGIPAQGLFFAIPSNTVAKIAEQLITEGRVAYPAIGVDLVPITEELVSQYGLPVDHGVYVRRLAPGGPAAQAGVREGDFILAVDGQRVDEENSFSERLFEHKPGDTVDVIVHRGGEELRLPVTLGELPLQGTGPRSR
ncbi:MAG: trypsin-like peptidase domain-containing protein [Chloroflexota bacterium]|nr:trypsin-like peptidase domain-containing protein [Chloroflexota bacterium]